jgi:regulator of protease activity HflC (stomatin/prohibitin superfamily)
MVVEGREAPSHRTRSDHRTNSHSPTIYQHHHSTHAAPLFNTNPAEDLALSCVSHGCLCLQCVRTQEIGFTETFGAFAEILGPGCYCLAWPMNTISTRLSLRVQQLDLTCEANTADKVFCQVKLSILYRVSVLHAYEASYRVANPRELLETLVLDVVRSTIPGIPLEELFASRDQIGDAVFSRLHAILTDYGYELQKVLLTRIEPNEMVRDALNAHPAAIRTKLAMAHQAEAHRVTRIKQAEGAAERSYLQGVGLARQRQALAASLRDSTTSWMDDVYVQAPTPGEIMELLLITQYFDVLTEVGAGHQVIMTF